MLKNESGVSEIIGALMILLIMIISLGIMQAYEVPKWNKEIEIQGFDMVKSDFLTLRHDISTAAIENIPIISTLHMGARYPERYFLRNPGQGATGLLTFEPVNVNLTIGSDKQNYTSYRIKYKMKGISDQPEMINEYGFIFNNFGKVQIPESNQSIIYGNKLFMPLIFSQFQSISGIEPESMNIIPLSDEDYNYTLVPSTVNVLLETGYPEIWNKTIGNMSGVKLTKTSGIWYINITKNINSLMYPKLPLSKSGGVGSGSITTELPDSFKKAGGIPSGPTGVQGAYSNEVEAMNRINIPSSDQITKFVISDLTGTTDSAGKYFVFSVTGQDRSFFLAKIIMGPVEPPNTVPITANAEIYTDITSKNMVFGTPIGSTGFVNISTGLDITPYYAIARIPAINTLRVNIWDDRSTQDMHDYRSYILYTRFVICSRSEPC